MSILIIFNREAYDSTDMTWNGLRLAEQLHEKNQEVRIFLMNDAVDMARDIYVLPPTYDQDLSKMLKALISKRVAVHACDTSIQRCGIYKNHPCFEGVEKSNIEELAQWVVDSDKVINF